MRNVKRIKSFFSDLYAKFRYKGLIYSFQFIFLILVLIVWGRIGYEFHNFSLSDTGIKEAEAYILDVPGEAEKVFTYRSTIIKNTDLQEYIKIYPDDCIQTITINGVNVDLSNIPDDKSGLCNYNNGLNLNVGKYLNLGENDFELKVLDLGGSVSVKLMNSYNDPIQQIMFALAAITIISIVIKAALDLGLKKTIIILIALSSLVYFSYLYTTPWFIRGHDVHGHIPFIEFVANNYSLPNPETCWECHQQPIYYIISAIFYKVLVLSGVEDKMVLYKFLNFLSILFFFGYIVIGLKILQRYIKSYFFLIFFSIIFVLWPSNILHSFRIGNDQLTYFLISLSIYFSVLYSQTWDKKYFHKAYLVALVAGLTKLTALCVLPVPFLLFFYDYFKLNTIYSTKKIIQKNWRPILKVFAVVILFTALIFQYQIRHGFTSDWLTVNKPGDEMLVDSSLINFSYIAVSKFISIPNISTYERDTGTQYFLHTLLKTSILGEFGIYNTNNFEIAKIMSLILLMSIIFFVITFLTSQVILSEFEIDNYLPLILFILIFSSLIYFRIKMPYTPNQDFRYILPIFIPSLIIIYQLYTKNKTKMSSLIMMTSMFMVVICSIIYFTNIWLGGY